MYVWNVPTVWGSKFDERIGNLAGGQEAGHEEDCEIGAFPQMDTARFSSGRHSDIRRPVRAWPSLSSSPPHRPRRPRRMSANSSRRPQRPS